MHRPRASLDEINRLGFRSLVSDTAMASSKYSQPRFIRLLMEVFRFDALAVGSRITVQVCARACCLEIHAQEGLIIFLLMPAVRIVALLLVLDVSYSVIFVRFVESSPLRGRSKYM
jgi:hypothetical protein